MRKTITFSVNFQIKQLRMGSWLLMSSISSSGYTRKPTTSVRRLLVRQLVTLWYLMSRPYQVSLPRWDFLHCQDGTFCFWNPKCYLLPPSHFHRTWQIADLRYTELFVSFDSNSIDILLPCRVLTPSTWRCRGTTTRNWAASRSGSPLGSPQMNSSELSTGSTPWM